MTDHLDGNDRTLHDARLELVGRLAHALEVPMTVLALVWLVLLVVDVTRGLNPFFFKVDELIWALFILQFVIELLVAPKRLAYLRGHWLTGLALLAPGLRVLRVARFAKVGRLGAVEVFAGLNRGVATLGRITRRRGFSYAMLLTLIVTVMGAVMIYDMEGRGGQSSVSDPGTAFYWAAMAITTTGSDYAPTTVGGRLLMLVLVSYGFAMFGYVTASIASVFVENDAESADARLAVEHRTQLAAVQAQVGALQEEVHRVVALLSAPRGPLG